MDKGYRKLLEKQGYAFIGEHSACKTCEYTCKSLAGKGTCYKERFYGINCHRCVQMTVSANFCNMDCIFCWRDRNNSPFEKLDDPKGLVDNAIAAQRKLLSGFGGNKSLDYQKWQESKMPMHFAISLNGENTAYPKLGEFIAEIHKRGMTSFLVTNGQLPEVLERITLPTQLYISLSAPNEELFKKIDRPMLKDGWKRLMKSLEFMKRAKTRTTIRLTAIKRLTTSDEHAKQFGALIKKASPMFIEVKSYMCLGASRKNLTSQNMATYEEITEFAKKVGKASGYKIIDGQPESRVVLMMKKDSPKRKMKF
ncbi:4-demethylwyosine synthase TYW1 [Candidatus Woesearchaeota archaeon]|nr:4-demethylwyosine synthase TYW1 [Candidatus Woesearchaeota archaeon]